MGRKVLVAGTFDIVHPGHVRMLSSAKRMAGPDGELVVVVARDSNVRRFKGRDPILPEEERLFVVSSLKPVDRAILGDPNDPINSVLREKPDVIALGYDQWPDEGELERRLREAGLRASIVRLPKFPCEHDSTTDIVERIVRIFCKDSR